MNLSSASAIVPSISEQRMHAAEDTKSEEKHVHALVTNDNKQEERSTAKKDKVELSPEAQRVIAELKNDEQKVKAHEQAHMSVGGGLAGGVSYSYTTGPDGKQYVSGGEVPIQFVKGSTPEETVQNMEQVKRAALAPADPSPQDHRVAAKASMLQLKAQQEAYKKDKENMQQYELERTQSNVSEHSEREESKVQAMFENNESSPNHIGERNSYTFISLAV